MARASAVALSLLLVIAVVVAVAGCIDMNPSAGGGQTKPPPSTTTRPVSAADVALSDGYRIEIVATGLNYPTGVAFDDRNRPFVTESGYAYGEDFAIPRLVRIKEDGVPVTVASGRRPPWNGLVFHDGNFYVAQGGEVEGGAVARIAPDGRETVLIEHLPSKGDHHTNGPAFGPDGALYFSIGTATNSGIVGPDNADFGWLERERNFHDIPAKDVKLAGVNVTTDDPFDKGKKVTTGAYVPFGTVTQPGQVIKGQIPCNGAIFKLPPDAPPGTPPQLVAWGLRNPFALAFAPDGRLFCAENGYDVRGSRPVYGAGDVLWRITPDTWYGWPDFHAGEPLTWSDHYKAPGSNHPAPTFLLAEHPNPPPRPAAILPVHGGYGGFDFARGEGNFGHPGQVFIAAFGDMAPAVGKVIAPVGFRVDRVDPNTGVIEAFATNVAKENGPASKLGTAGLERPVACRFDNTGSALYVVDFGIVTMDGKTPRPLQHTGVLWRITRTAPRPPQREGSR